MKVISKVKPYFLYFIFVPVLYCFLQAAVAAENTGATAQQLINKMSRAARELNYDGVFIYRRGRQMDTLRLIHKYDGEDEFERLVSLTGSPREVIRNKESVTCIFSDEQSILVEKSRPQKFISSKLPEPIEKIADHYTFELAGQDRVAGKQTWIVKIIPKDSFRYGYQLWIDQNNHLLLRSELKNKSGYTLEQIMFTQLDDFNSLPDDLLKASIMVDGYKWYSTASREKVVQSDTKYWKVGWMPKGFIMSDHEQQSMLASEKPVNHMVFTDGLAMVSVFIERLGEQSQFTPGPSKMGAVNTFARMTNGYQVTAVGEVPQTTVQRMANSTITGK